MIGGLVWWWGGVVAFVVSAATLAVAVVLDGWSWVLGVGVAAEIALAAWLLVIRVLVTRAREGREVWRRLEEEQRTRVVGQIAVTFPPGTPPAEIDGWEAAYRGRVPEPWFGPEDVL